MSADGQNSNDLEDNYKKLTQKLQSVYRSVKSNQDSENSDRQKEEFIKLFCKAFDWNADYEEEDNDGLQFVDDGADTDADADEDQLVEEEDETPLENKEKKETPDKNSMVMTNVTDSAQKKNGDVSKPITVKETKIDPKHADKAGTEDSSTNRNHTNDTYSQPDAVMDKPPSTTTTNTFPLDTSTTSVATKPSDDMNSMTTGPKPDENLTKQTSETNNNSALPSLAALGNASETVQLLVGNTTLAKQLAVSMKGENEWHRENSNDSWSSDFSGNSSTHDHDHEDQSIVVQADKSAIAGSKAPSVTANAAKQVPIHDTTNPERNGGNNSKDDNKNNLGTGTTETHVVRQVLRQLVLMLLQHHPNGVYESELQGKYQQMTENKPKIDDTIQYLLFNHRNVLVTPCVNRGNLLTLNHQSIPSVLEEYALGEISSSISGHINVVMKLFPCGISAEILDEMMFNFYGYKLSQLVSDIEKFMTTHCNVTPNTSEGVLVYMPLDSTGAKPIGHHSQVLSTAIGYRELLIALLAHHDKPINIDQLENEFVELFDIKLNAYSPVINRILKKINDPTLNQEQKQSQLQHASQTLDESNASRSSLRNSNSSLKSIITKFRLASNFELHYEKNRALFELFCPKCRQDNAVIKSPFKEDHRTVFMGGFAHGTSTKELEDALAEYGAKMVDCKGISFRNYGWSFVVVETPQQAEDLIARSPIQIRGRNIDVRPFIDRKRVKNHQQNRPSPKKLLAAVLEAVQQNPSGLTVAQMQTNLFHKFQFRVDGPDITKLVSRNAKLLQIKRHPIERIVLTPKMHRLKMDELKWKILKIWNSADGSQDGADEQGGTPEGEKKVKEQKVLSLAEFENEFARRYKAYLDPNLYGYNSVYNLLQSMTDILCFPQIRSQSHMENQNSMSPPHADLLVPVVAAPKAVVTPNSMVTAADLVNGGATNQGLSVVSNVPAGTAVSLTENKGSANNLARKVTLSANLKTAGMETVGNNGSATMYMHPGSVMHSSAGGMMHAFPSSIYSNYPPINLMNNGRFPITTQTPMDAGHIMPQTSDVEPPKPSWPTLDNMWSLQSIPASQQQPIFLPSLSNLGGFSNRSLENMSTGKQNNIMVDTNPSILPLFNQLSNGSQFGNMAKSSR